MRSAGCRYVGGPVHSLRIDGPRRPSRPTERALTLDVWSRFWSPPGSWRAVGAVRTSGKPGQRKISARRHCNTCTIRAQAMLILCRAARRGVRLQQPNSRLPPLDPALAVDAEQRGLLPAGCERSRASGRRHRADPLQRRERVYALGRLLPSHRGQSCRRSLGVVATPLAVLPEPFPGAPLQRSSRRHAAL